MEGPPRNILAQFNLEYLIVNTISDVFKSFEVKAANLRIAKQMQCACYKLLIYFIDLLVGLISFLLCIIIHEYLNIILSYHKLLHGFLPSKYFLIVLFEIC